MLMTDIQTGYPSVDKPWLKYYTGDDLKIKDPMCTIYQNIYTRNREFPDDISINYFGNQIKYAELFRHVEECARTLCCIGIKKGDCVTLCTAGVPEAIYIVLACSRIGAIANLINPLFTTEQMIDRINDTCAEWIIILDAMYHFIEKALSSTCIRNVVIIPATNSVPPIVSGLLYLKSDARKIINSSLDIGKRIVSWKNFIKMGNSYSREIDVKYEKDTPVIMVYSSGSTGASKGILLTNDGVNATILNYQTHSFAYERGDTFLQMIPIWFSTGIVLSMLMPLVYGITVIPEPKFGTESFVKDLLKYKPSLTLTATSLWIYAINSEKMVKVDMSRMKYPITGGEKLLPQDEKRINDFLREHGCKTEIIKGYGMCELGGTVSTTSPDTKKASKIGGIGYPILNVSVAAFDLATDHELPYGERGEIRVCSPARMKEYYKNPEATNEYFKTDDEGRIWGCTGDIGFVDEDGEVFILGRATDCFHSDNGQTVYLFDIEDKIFEDEYINQCKVVDIDENGVKKLVAHIVFCEDTKNQDEHIKMIISHLSETLPEYMRPDYYKIRSSMPVHSNGKRDVGSLRVDREDLRSVASLS